METVEGSFVAVDVADAYEQLSQEAFAVWVRLHVASDDQLKEGRQRLATVLGYSENRSNCILRELKHAGYVALHRGPRSGTPTAVELVKRLKVSGRARFVRLSRVVGGAFCTQDDLGVIEHSDLSASKMQIVQQDVLAASLKSVLSKVTDRLQPVGSDIPDWDMTGLDGLIDSAPRCNQPVEEKSPAKPTKSTRKSLLSIVHASDSSDDHPLAETRRKHKFLAPGGGLKIASDSDHDAETIASYIEGSNVDLSRLPSKQERRAKRVLSRQQMPKSPASGQPIDWDEIDQDKNGEPVVTFTMSQSKREAMIKLLTLDARRLSADQRKMRKAMLAKLRREFTRIYTRYRRAAYREMGRANTDYSVMANEEKYAEQAAVSCIVKGVTPRQLLEYWHDNIKTFADRSMQVPPITFLAQPANVDRVAIAGMSRDAASGAPPASRAGGMKTISQNTYGDLSKLHPQLRRGLMEADFDLSKINDRYLCSVQAYAVDVANGYDIKLFPESMRDMIRWAVTNIYSKISDLSVYY